MRQSIATSLVFVATLTVAACGGGGGGGGGAQAPTVTISGANAERIAEAAVAATNAANAANAQGSLAGAGQATVLSATAVRRLSGHAVAQQQESGTEFCDTPASGPTGTIDYVVNDADNNFDISRNDTIDATMHNCFLADANVTANGRMFLRVASVGTSSLGFNAQYTNFSLDIPTISRTPTVNGNIDFTVSQTSANSAQVAITGGNMSAQDSSDTLTISSPNLTLNVNVGTNRYSYFGGATVNSQQAGGVFSYNIPSTSPLTGSIGSEPDSGIVNITGANSSMVATPIGGNSVRLDIDTTGDQIVDESRTVTWDQIFS